MVMFKKLETKKYNKRKKRDFILHISSNSSVTDLIFNFALLTIILYGKL